MFLNSNVHKLLDKIPRTYSWEVSRFENDDEHAKFIKKSVPQKSIILR